MKLSITMAILAVLAPAILALPVATTNAGRLHKRFDVGEFLVEDPKDYFNPHPAASFIPQEPPKSVYGDPDSSD
ncbi:hypothetical protein SLS58_008736 [Diplodia intermedia]|uniref:Uncharacterized protein n=1 Tax=Diplodia intermedia TaxID=856260 RepID=A0ABR3TGF4_9PEZI